MFSNIFIGFNLLPLIINPLGTNAIQFDNIVFSESEYTSQLNRINNYSYNDLKNSELNNISKHALIEFHQNHNYVSKPLLNEAKDFLVENDLDFMEYPSFLLKSGVGSLTFNFKNYSSSSGGVIIEDTNDGLLPIIDGESEQSTIKSPNYLGNRLLIGIYCDKDFAIELYNIIVNFINNYNPTTREISSQVFKNIKQSFSLFMINITPFIAYMCTLISNFAPTLLLKSIVAVVGISIGLYIGAAIYFGARGTGFFVGLVRNGFLDWDFEVGLV